MDLQSLIQTVPGWESKSPQDIADELNAATVEVRDDQLYTWAGIAWLVGPQAAEEIRLALEANGMAWAVHQLGGSGLQLSNELVQQTLWAFNEAGISACSTLATKGISTITPWKSAGLANAPTAEEIATAVDSIILRRQWFTLQNEAINPASSDRALLVAALRQAADELEG